MQDVLVDKSHPLSDLSVDCACRVQVMRQHDKDFGHVVHDLSSQMTSWRSRCKPSGRHPTTIKIDLETNKVVDFLKLDLETNKIVDFVEFDVGKPFQLQESIKISQLAPRFRIFYEESALEMRPRKTGGVCLGGGRGGEITIVGYLWSGLMDGPRLTPPPNLERPTFGGSTPTKRHQTTIVGVVTKPYSM